MTFTKGNWQIERLVVGELMVNCYIVAWTPTSDAIVVDPGGEAERIIDCLNELNVHLVSIVNTHGHGDHIGGNDELKTTLGVPLIIGKGDAEMLTDPMKNLSAPFGYSVVSPKADRLLSEGDVLEIGDGRLKVFETPGHSPGSLSFVGEGFAIVGDLLFAGSIGRTDFPRGDFNLLVKMVREKIFPLGDDCLVLSGHGPETTVGIERRTNPFLQEGSQFCYL